MLFTPKKTKFKKAFKGSLKGKSTKGCTLAYGDYGLKALGSFRVNGKHLEAVRRVISRTIYKVGKVWIRVFPNIPVSKKPADVRMGKGKGAVEEWVFKVKPGRILFEIAGIPKEDAFLALTKATKKLPLKWKLVTREDYIYEN